MEACGMKVDVSGTKPGAGGINADVGGTNVDIGGRKADTGGTKAHVDGTKFDVGGRNADVDGTKTDVGSSKFDVGGWVCSEPVMVTSDEVSATAVSSVRAVTLADTVDRLSVVGIAEALFVAPASNKQHHITLQNYSPLTMASANKKLQCPLNRVPDSAGVRAGMSPLSGGR